MQNQSLKTRKCGMSKSIKKWLKQQENGSIK